MDHISEDELALYAFSATAVSPERREAIERHTAACASCRSTRDFFAVAEEDLSDVDMWEQIAGSATLEALTAYAERIAEEDAEAEEILSPLFAAPAKSCLEEPARRAALPHGRRGTEAQHPRARGLRERAARRAHVRRSRHYDRGGIAGRPLSRKGRL